MTAELDALVDRIVGRLSADARLPTPGEARQVGRLALDLANKKLSALPSSSAPVASAVTVPDSPVYHNLAFQVRRRLTLAAANCKPPSLTTFHGGPPTSVVQWHGCGITSLNNEQKERLRLPKAVKR